MNPGTLTHDLMVFNFFLRRVYIAKMIRKEREYTEDQFRQPGDYNIRSLFFNVNRYVN